MAHYKILLPFALFSSSSAKKQQVLEEIYTNNEKSA